MAYQAIRVTAGFDGRRNQVALRLVAPRARYISRVLRESLFVLVVEFVAVPEDGVLGD